MEGKKSVVQKVANCQSFQLYSRIDKIINQKKIKKKNTYNINNYT